MQPSPRQSRCPAKERFLLPLSLLHVMAPRESLCLYCRESRSRLPPSGGTSSSPPGVSVPDPHAVALLSISKFCPEEISFDTRRMKQERDMVTDSASTKRRRRADLRSLSRSSCLCKHRKTHRGPKAGFKTQHRIQHLPLG